MTNEWVDKALDDFAKSHASSGDATLDAVQTAIFLEDVFEVVLSDAEINVQNLGSPEAVRRMLARRGVS